MPLERLKTAGYTLVEMLITTSIIAVLASVALPKYADSLRRAQEGSLKGNLGSLRSAFQIYYSDTAGTNPSCAVGPSSSVFNDALLPKYMGVVPVVKNGLHPPTNNVYCDSMILPGYVHDGQGWYYDGALPSDSQFGGVWVACDHTDSRGSVWTSY